MRSTILASLIVVVLTPLCLSAQDRQPRHVSFSVGVIDYEFGREGLAPVATMRMSTPLVNVLTLEAGLTGSRPGLNGGTATFLAPEAQVQLALPFVNVVPYMGLGAGAVVDMRNAAMGGNQVDFTISGSLGLRTWIGDRLGLQFEFRGRGIGSDFSGTSAEYTAGLAWRY